VRASRHRQENGADLVRNFHQSRRMDFNWGIRGT